jgi:hypothetical protein
LNFVPYFIEKKSIRWVGLNRAARFYAATTPDFLPAEYVATVNLVGQPLDYVISLGYNIYTQRGEEMVDFHTALYLFCRLRCDLGLGWQQYDPAPFPGGPPPPPDNGNGGEAGNAFGPAPGAVEPEIVPGDHAQPQGQHNADPADPGPLIPPAAYPHQLGPNVGIGYPMPAPQMNNGAVEGLDPEDIIILD